MVDNHPIKRRNYGKTRRKNRSNNCFHEKHRRAIAEAYLAEGAKVVVSGRSRRRGKKHLKKWGQEIMQYSSPVMLRNKLMWKGLLIKRLTILGIDIAVLNAGGILNAAPVVDMTDESWNHLKSELKPYFGNEEIFAIYDSSRMGRIIAISSVEGKMKVETCSHYTATKHAINGLVKTAAHEVGTFGVTVNAILGFTKTDLFYESAPQTAEALGMDSLDEVADMYSQDRH